MDLGLSGRRALVTAASKGLGRACAQALAGEGAQVFVSSRDGAEIEKVGHALGAAGWLAADVSRAQDVEKLVRGAAERLGGLDILVANAGGPPPGKFESIDDKGWESAMQLTLMSAVRLVRLSLPYVRESDQGRIVFITSISVRQPIPNLVLSNSLRAAVTGLAKTIAAEVARERVTVNCIAPDAIRTDALRRLGDLGEMEKRAPMGRLGEADEVGALCAFLCSRQAGYLTGQTVGIDGGSLAGVH